MNEISVFGKKISQNVCTALPVRISVKRFPYYMVSSISAFFSKDRIKHADGGETKDAGTTMTEDEIIELLNEATDFEITSNDGEDLLIINTELFKIVVVVNKGV